VRRTVVTAAVVAVVLAMAVIAIVLVVRAPEAKDPDTAQDDATPSGTPTAASTDPGHSPDDGHDHIDDVDPGIDPDQYTDFCASFTVLVDAYTQRTAQRTPETVAAAEAAGADFLAVGAEAEMTDEVRAGFEAFVADVLEQPATVTTEQQGAFSTFLNSACPLR
jgi:hypothetical protein